jgi:hypothetical protein
MSTTTEETCSNCRSWYEYGEQCRAHPPVVLLYRAHDEEREWPHSEYPNAPPTGWCGEWKDGRP